MKYYIVSATRSDVSIIYSDDYEFDNDEIETWTFQGGGVLHFASLEFEKARIAAWAYLQEQRRDAQRSLDRLPKTKEELNA